MSDGNDVRGEYDAAFAAWRAVCGHAGPADGCAACGAYLAACEAFISALRAENAADAAEGYRYVCLEAICTVCGQAFNPCDDSDLIHLITTVPAGEAWGPDDYTGDLPEGPERYCGGRGAMLGGYR